MRTRREKQSVTSAAVVAILLIAVVVSVWVRGQGIRRISYADHMNDVAVTVDGTEYTLRDLAFYLAYQELALEEQAKVYDIENPRKYLRVHVNHSFIISDAKDYAMDMAVHDAVFYHMAVENGIELTQEEREFMENQKMDFWNDLEEERRKRLGVSKEEIGETIYHMALAQKMQRFLAELENVAYERYDVEGDLYEGLLKTHTCEINERLWGRLRFGKIILD